MDSSTIRERTYLFKKNLLPIFWARDSELHGLKGSYSMIREGT
jgi:hypothetical protein